MSQPTQRFVGTIVHQVLDRAHAHYAGKLDPSKKTQVPSDPEIEAYFNEVAGALTAHGIRAITPNIKEYALELIQRFNKLEGPTLYPRVVDTEHRLQSERTITTPPFLLYGVVDVLATSASSPGKAEIWDYKATKAPDPNTKDGQLRLRDYTFQMQVYAELYNQRNGVYPEAGVIYFLGELRGASAPTTRPAAALVPVTIQPHAVTAALQAFDQTVVDIRQSRQQQTWNPPPGGAAVAGKETCDLCDVRWTCPQMKGVYPPRIP